jgi:undecaprenyl-diphosphatase
MATTHEVPTIDAVREADQAHDEAVTEPSDSDDGSKRRLRDINHTWPLTWGDGAKFLAVYAVMCGVWIGMGMAITHGLQHSWLQRTDEHIEVWLSQHRTHTLNTLTFIGSQLADTMVKIAATALIALGMLFAWRRWKEPLFVVAALILEASVFITTTWTVGRPRPDVPRLETSPVGSSFPSGHVAAAVVYSAIAVVVFWHTRKRWARVLAVCVVTFIVLAAGFSRMYRGMHHLSDVIAGILLGLVAVFATYVIVQHASNRHGEEVARSRTTAP